MNIHDKVVIVTGASSGIGLAVSRLLTQKGAKIALVARSTKLLQSLSKELPNSYVRTTDMIDEKDVTGMIHDIANHYGRIDVLINNAGQAYDVSTEQIDTTIFHSLFNLDVVGPVVAMKNVIPIMRKQQGGTIINISSGTALMALPQMGAYSSLKRALVGISLTARAELQRDHIVVSVVYPYMTHTNFEKNTITDHHQGWDSGSLPHPIDPPEYVAEKILEAMQTGEAEVYAHEWMNHRT